MKPMKPMNLFAHHRATLKLLFLGALSLAMLVPLSMVHSVVAERQNLQLAAERTIAGRWGGSQSVSGLVALTEVPVDEQPERPADQRTVWQANVLSEVTIDADLTTEWRYLGIYRIPVYSVVVDVRGRIDWTQIDHLQSSGDLQFWLPLGDVRGVRDVSTLKLGELQIPARPISVAAETITGLQFTLSAGDRGRAGPDYQLQITLAGSHSLIFLPLADTTRVALDADWPHPEFVGQFLPIERSIADSGTTASWQLPGLNRPYGDHWTLDETGLQQLNLARFGMRLETPVDGYQRSERAVKYGCLFISLTFLTLFLFEVLTGRPLHPVPYLLTGAALAVFYLVLLALSEYLSFGVAFLTAAALLVLIVTPYTGAVLGERRHGYLVGAMMSLTYALLYILISAEHAALLMGSLALLAAIAALMYLTRRVDWYGYGKDGGPS
ncbi:MAG: cell envelope integrity protein CreD [Lysobacterales bacterium]